MKLVVLLCFFISVLLFSIGGVAYFREMSNWGVWIIVGVVAGAAGIITAAEYSDDL